MTHPTHEEYCDVIKRRDYAQIERYIRQGMPFEPLKKWGIILTAGHIAAIEGNFTLVDALLSRPDVREAALEEMLYDYELTVPFLQYLEAHGANLKDICTRARKNKDDVLDVLLSLSFLTDSDLKEEGKEALDKRCQRICEVIDFFISRGLDPAEAHKELLKSAKPGYPWYHIMEEYYVQIEPHLRPPTQ